MKYIRVNVYLVILKARTVQGHESGREYVVWTSHNDVPQPAIFADYSEAQTEMNRLAKSHPSETYEVVASQIELNLPESATVRETFPGGVDRTPA